LNRPVMVNRTRFSLVGDNLGDFSDGYKGNEAARLKVCEDNAAHWGKDWIVVANPTYGSFESALMGTTTSSVEEQRAAKGEGTGDMARTLTMTCQLLGSRRWRQTNIRL